MSGRGRQDRMAEGEAFSCSLGDGVGEVVGGVAMSN